MRSTKDEDTNLLEHTQDVDSPRVGDAASIVTFNHMESATNDSTAFDGELETLRPQILMLTCMISANNYLAAWAAKQDVTRTIERVRLCLARIPEGPAQENAMSRLRSVLEITEQMMTRAPSPSPDAIRQASQARSTGWTADRGIWEREEREWRARNASAAPTIYVAKTAMRHAESKLSGALGIAAAGASSTSSKGPRMAELPGEPPSASASLGDDACGDQPSPIDLAIREP